MNSVNWKEGCRAVFCRKYNVKRQFCMGRFLCFFYDKIINMINERKDHIR